MTHYLSHVWNTWRLILGDIPGSVVDVKTLSCLELLAPAVSSRDKRVVNDLMAKKEIFPTLDTPQRALVLGKIMTVTCLIPSLWSFFENLKYIEPCCQILKQLIPARKRDQKKSLRQAIYASYVRPQDLRLEISEGRNVSMTAISLSVDRELSYQQLWLYAMRHFPEMTDFKPRKEPRKEKPACTQSNPMLWQQFGALAEHLGFHNSQAKSLEIQDPDQKLVKELLQRSGVSEHNDSCSSNIAKILKSARASNQRACRTDEMPLTTDATGANKDHRAGRPFEDSHVADKNSLFLPLMYRVSEGKDDLTTLYSKKDMLCSFLGTCDVNAALDFAGAVERQGPESMCLDPPNPHRPTVSMLEAETQELKRNLAVANQEIDRLNAQSAELSVLRDQMNEQASKLAAVDAKWLKAEEAAQAAQKTSYELSGKCSALQIELQKKATLQLQLESLPEQAHQQRLEAERAVQAARDESQQLSDKCITLQNRLDQTQNDKLASSQRYEGSAESAPAMLAQVERMGPDVTLTNVILEEGTFKFTRIFLHESEIPSMAETVQKIVQEGSSVVIWERAGTFLVNTRNEPLAYLITSWKSARNCWIVPASERQRISNFASQRATSGAIHKIAKNERRNERRKPRDRTRLKSMGKPRKRVDELDADGVDTTMRDGGNMGKPRRRVDELDDDGVDTTMHEGDAGEGEAEDEEL